MAEFGGNRGHRGPPSIPQPHIPGPPYPSVFAILGGTPNFSVDVPLSGVFIVLYALGAAGNITLLITNKRRGHKFRLSMLMVALCMMRLPTMALRIAWAYYPRNVQLSIASLIFAATGSLFIYVLNLIFTERILRATHPRIGWSKSLSIVFILLFILFPILLILSILAVVQSKYTLNATTIDDDIETELGAQCFLLFVSILPQLVVAGCLLFPRRDGNPIDHFGEGSMSTKAIILAVGSFIISFGLAFRVGIGFQDYYHPRLANNPGWYNSKAAYWIFYFVVEILVVYFYLAVRVDLRFYIPDGSKGSYSSEKEEIMQSYNNGETVEGSDEPANSRELQGTRYEANYSADTGSRASPIEGERRGTFLSV